MLLILIHALLVCIYISSINRFFLLSTSQIKMYLGAIEIVWYLVRGERHVSNIVHGFIVQLGHDRQRVKHLAHEVESDEQ